MNVEQCKALGLVPYAVYGGRVETFKVRETDPATYGDPVLLKVLDELIAIKEQVLAGEPFDSQELEDMGGRSFCDRCRSKDDCIIWIDQAPIVQCDLWRK